MGWKNLGAVLVVCSLDAGADRARIFQRTKDTNAFNHYKDEYVCFRDDDTPSFVVVAKIARMIEHMKQAGETPGKELYEAKDDLFEQSYHKRVATSQGDLYTHVGKDGTNYDLEFMKPFHGRVVYSITWLTGRYRYLLYELDHSKTLRAVESSGKCEVIHPGT